MKKIVLGWILIFSLSACGIFKSAPENRTIDKKDPVKKEEIEDKRDKPEEHDEIDTLWKDEVVVDTSLIFQDTLVKIEPKRFNKKDQYSIKLLLPLLPLDQSVETSEEDKEVDRSLNSWNLSFMEYLAGFKLGLSSFNDTVSDFSYRLSVISTEDMDHVITDKKDSLSFSDADILLGGVTRNSLEKLSSWSVEKEKIYISPWVPFQPLAKNTRFIQLSPSLQKHCDALTSYLMKEYKLENIFLISFKENNERMDCFNSYFIDQGINTRFQEILLSKDFELEELQELSDVFHKEDTNIVIIPESRNKAFVHRVISRLSVLDDYKFKVVGLPGWLKYDLLYNYFEKMPFILSVDQHLNKDSADYEEFEKIYFNRFHSLPTEWSIKGFDQAIFIAKGLYKYGLDMPNNLKNIQFEGVGMDVNFVDPKVEQSLESDLYDNVNNAVQIIEYKDHQFHKVSQ